MNKCPSCGSKLKILPSKCSACGADLHLSSMSTKIVNIYLFLQSILLVVGMHYLFNTGFDFKGNLNNLKIGGIIYSVSTIIIVFIYLIFFAKYKVKT